MSEYVEDSEGNKYRVTPKGAIAFVVQRVFTSIGRDDLATNFEIAGYIADQIEVSLAQAGYTILAFDDITFNTEGTDGS